MELKSRRLGGSFRRRSCSPSCISVSRLPFSILHHSVRYVTPARTRHIIMCPICLRIRWYKDGVKHYIMLPPSRLALKTKDLWISWSITHLFGTSINWITDHFRCSVLILPYNNRSSNACDTFALNVNIIALKNIQNDALIQNPTNNIDAILIVYNSCKVHGFYYFRISANTL